MSWPGGVTFEADMSPLLAMAERLGRPMEEIGAAVAAIMQRGAGRQFSARSSFDGTGSTSWPTSMVLSGDLQRAWTGGAGSFVEIKPRGVFIGVDDPDYVATWHRDTAAQWPSGYSLEPRPIGVGQAELEEIALLELQYINGPGEPLEA